MFTSSPGYLGSHHSTFIKCSHTDGGGLTGFLFPNTRLEQLHFEVLSIENEVILIIIKQNKQKSTQFLTNNNQRK